MGVELVQEVARFEEALRRPGVQSVRAQRMVRMFRADLQFYFRRLARLVEPLGLEQFAGVFALADDEQLTPAAQVVIEREVDKMTEPVVEALSPQLEEIAQQHMKDLYRLAQRLASEMADRMEAGFSEQQQPFEGPVDPNAVEFAARRTATLVRGVNEETRRRLRELIARGIRDREGVPGLARLIRSELGLMTRHRAELIATTEMNDAMSEATLQRLQTRGIQAKTTVLSNNPCPICIRNNAQGPIRIDEPFASGHQRPPFHPRCECAQVGARLRGPI